MGKRFVSAEWYDQDWFLELSPNERDLWYFVNADCDCAGVLVPSIKRYERLTGTKVDFEKFLKKVNADQERIVKLPNGNYFIRNFIPFQYCKDKLRLNLGSTVHLGVYRCLISNQIDIDLIYPKIEIVGDFPEKDYKSLSRDHQSLKDKDTDKEKYKDNGKANLEKKSTLEIKHDLKAKLYGKESFEDCTEEQQQDLKSTDNTEFIEYQKAPF
ncbi:hypothetical protein ACFLU5_17750 [Bacteroidota bacterium]